MIEETRLAAVIQHSFVPRFALASIVDVFRVKRDIQRALVADVSAIATCVVFVVTFGPIHAIIAIILGSLLLGSAAFYAVMAYRVTARHWRSRILTGSTLQVRYGRDQIRLDFGNGLYLIYNYSQFTKLTQSFGVVVLSGGLKSMPLPVEICPRAVKTWLQQRITPTPAA